MSNDTTTALATTTGNDTAMVPADPMAIFRTMEQIISSSFVESLAKSGLYGERGDSHEVTRHKIVSKIAHGMELGLTPMASLSNVNIIKGKPTLGAIMIGSIVMRSRTMRYEVIESSDKVCRMRWIRDGVEVGINQWTIEDARRAGLNGDNWKKYPVDMLRSRCITQGARTYCPDLFGGPIYVPEELRSEVVAVSQNQSGRMPGVNHPDILQRPDGRAQADHGKERIEARNRLVTVVKDCTTSREQQVRVWKACLMKADKPDKMMTSEDFSEASGRVKALHDDDNLSEWCDTIHGPDDDVVGEAEVVEEDADAKAWRSANGLFHAVLGKFLAGNGHEKTGREYTVIKDVVRSNCELAAEAEWSEVTPDAMRQTAKVLEYDGGKMAKIGLSGDWASLAAERGAI